MGWIALLLSSAAWMVPGIAATGILISGIVAVLVNRNQILAGVVLSINFLPLLGWHSVVIAEDWLVTRQWLASADLILLLFVVQSILMCILIWQWAFPVEPVVTPLNHSKEEES